MTGSVSPAVGQQELSPQQPAAASTIRVAEWNALAYAICSALVVVALPYAHGFVSARRGWRFSGFVGLYIDDYNSYLAWIRQAQEGFILFRDLYTTEPHGRIFFHPLFLLMGIASRLTGSSALATWYAVQALSTVTMMVALYWLLSHVTEDRVVRWLGLGLAMTAGGLGFLTNAAAPTTTRPIDLWMPEANAFEAICTSAFTLPFSLALMLITFALVLRHYEHGRVRDAALAGLAALLLSTTHQYDMVTLYAVIGTHALFDLRRRWKGMAVVFTASLPGTLYSMAVVWFDPVFSAHRDAIMRSPDLSAHLIGWGIPLGLAALALAVPSLRRGRRDVGFLVTWLIVQLVLLALPLNFQRKLTWGVHVPICMLAALAVVNAFRDWRPASGETKRQRVLVAASITLLVICSMGNVIFYVDLFKANRAHFMLDYLPVEYLQAFRWLEAHSASGDVVIAPSDLAQFIPGRTGDSTFIGHWAQTIDGKRKATFVARLLEGDTRSLDAREIRILRRNRVRFIVLDDFSRVTMGIPQSRTTFSFSASARVVFQNRLVTIWQLSPEMEPLEWGNGRWDD